MTENTIEDTLKLPILRLGASVWCGKCGEPHLIAELDNSKYNGPDFYYCPKAGLGDFPLFSNVSADDALRYKVEMQHVRRIRAELASKKA